MITSGGNRNPENADNVGVGVGFLDCDDSSIDLPPHSVRGQRNRALTAVWSGESDAEPDDDVAVVVVDDHHPSCRITDGHRASRAAHAHRRRSGEDDP